MDKLLDRTLPGLTTTSVEDIGRYLDLWLCDYIMSSGYPIRWYDEWDPFVHIPVTLVVHFFLGGS